MAVGGWSRKWGGFLGESKWNWLGEWEWILTRDTQRSMPDLSCLKPFSHRFMELLWMQNSRVHFNHNTSLIEEDSFCNGASRGEGKGKGEGEVNIWARVLWLFAVLSHGSHEVVVPSHISQVWWISSLEVAELSSIIILSVIYVVVFFCFFCCFFKLENFFFNVEIFFPLLHWTSRWVYQDNLEAPPHLSPLGHTRVSRPWVHTLPTVGPMCATPRPGSTLPPGVSAAQREVVECPRLAAALGELQPGPLEPRESLRSSS